MKRMLLSLLVVLMLFVAGTPAEARHARVVAGYVPVYPVYRPYVAKVYYPRRVYYPVYPVYVAPVPVAVPAVVVPY